MEHLPGLRRDPRRTGGRQKVADLRRLCAAMEAPRSGMDVLIVPGRPLVLSQMLGPARQEEPLDPHAGVGRVLIDSPVVRAVAVAFAGEFMHGGEE